MATSATTIGATAQFYIGNQLTATTRRTNDNLILERRRKDAKHRQLKSWLIKISNSDTTAEATTPESTGPESSVQVAEERPSLISAINVDKAFRGIAISEVDHYEKLGLARECSYDQIEKAYNMKVDELMKQDLEEEEEEELNNNLQLLKKSYIILSSPVERRMYDWSVARNRDGDEYTWPYEVDTTQLVSPDDPPQEAEDHGPTRLVGYFMLAWLLLSFALSIYINS